MSHRKHCRFLSPKLFLSLPLAADRSMFKHWLIQSTKERFMKSYAGIITSIAILSTWTVTDCNAQIQSNPQLNTIIIGTNATTLGQPGVQNNLGTALGSTNSLTGRGLGLGQQGILTTGPQTNQPAILVQTNGPAMLSPSNRPAIGPQSGGVILGPQSSQPAIGQQGSGTSAGQQGTTAIAPQSSGTVVVPPFSPSTPATPGAAPSKR